jgi:transcriptional regulator with XRE-family HTH domain
MLSSEPLTALRFARQQAGLTLTEFARELGMNKGLVSRLERGEARPWPSFRRRAAEILGVQEVALFGQQGHGRRS